MTTLTQFAPLRSPLQDVAVLQNRLNSIFNDFARPGSDDEIVSGSFIPAVDIYEDSQRLVLKLEVPGIKQDDLEIHIENQVLTIKGERRFESDEKEQDFHRIERRYGIFVRNFSLPQTVDTGNVSADYEAGVLSISLPKKAESKPRQVKIAIGGAKPQQMIAENSAPAGAKTAA